LHGLSLSMYGERENGNPEERRGEERVTIDLLLVCLLASLYIFEFPLPLLLILLFYFLTSHGLHAVG
jgi:hypothetical protein